jgi:hypothetical protein
MLVRDAYKIRFCNWLFDVSYPDTDIAFQLSLLNESILHLHRTQT